MRSCTYFGKYNFRVQEPCSLPPPPPHHSVTSVKTLHTFNLQPFRDQFWSCLKWSGDWSVSKQGKNTFLKLCVIVMVSKKEKEKKNWWTLWSACLKHLKQVPGTILILLLQVHKQWHILCCLTRYPSGIIYRVKFEDLNQGSGFKVPSVLYTS